jgi:hypothetical protein
MIAEALQKLFDVARESRQAQVVQIPGDKTVMIVGDERIEIQNDRRPRKAVVGNLSSVDAWLQTVGAERDIEIVVDRDEIRASVDCCTHIVDFCRMPLHITQAAQALLGWSEKPIGIKQAVRILRSSLADCCDPNYLAIFRRIDFNRMSNSQKSIRHDSESLGKSIERVAQSSHGEIPEYVTFAIPFYQVGIAMSKQTLRFAVEVDAESETITLLPVDDCINRACEESRKELAEWLSKSCPAALVLVGFASQA